MTTEKFQIDGISGQSLMNERKLNHTLLTLRMKNKEHNMFYDADSKTATVIWND